MTQDNNGSREEKRDDHRPKVNPVLAHLEAIATGIKWLTRKPMTLMYPDMEEKKPEYFRGFIIFNYDKCIGCSLCAQVCPPRAIHMYRVPGDKRIRPGYDAGRCIHCGLCTDICPTDALGVSPVHDEVFEQVESMDFDPVEWHIISKKLVEEHAKRKRKLVITRVDEEVGLRYEPVE